MNYVVIFAGGTGSRMNTKSRPKQFLEVHGKPILIYTLEKFNENQDIEGIVLVCIESWIRFAQKLIKQFNIDKVKAVVPGGSCGQESIFNGISKAHEMAGDDNSIVLIHDGVRPMIDDETISACIACVKEHGNAITTAPAIETIFVNDESEKVGNIFNRSKCLMARAPQCFYLKEIYENHLKAREEEKFDFIDSAMLMQYYGAELYTVAGPVDNIKITTPTDFYLFRALLDARESMQIVGL